MIKNNLLAASSGAHKVNQPNIPPTHNKYIPTIEERIKQRRLQMLVHSCIYYEMGTSVISDAQFDKWAYELRDLQRQYPDISEKVIYYDAFKEWDGTTGFNLPYLRFRKRAEWLVEVHKHGNTK